MRCEPVKGCITALVVAFSAAGCATGGGPEKDSWDDVWRTSSRGTGGSGPVAAGKPKMKPAAQEYIPPLDCERRARALRSRDRDAAWAALRACAAKGHFTQLRAVVSAWGEDLRERPDAPALLAQMVAARGGNVKADVRVMRDARIPVFTLHDCVSQPKLYEGRYVMIRGSLGDVRTQGEAVAARLFERRLQAEEWEIPVGPVRRRLASTQYGASASGQTTLGSGQVGGRLDVRDDDYEMDVARRFDNVLVDTGQEAVVRIPAPDPYLEAGRDLVFLARFDGVRPSSAGADEDDPDLVPVLTLLGYEVPDALVMD